MKKIILILILLQASLLASATGSRKVVAHFNETNELMSTLMYLADAEEYTWCYFPELTEAIDDYFGDYRTLAVVDSIKHYRNHGLCYDLPMNLALRLEIRNGHVARIPGIITDGEYSQRMPEELNRQVVALMDEFYCKTDFHKFYRQQRALYKKAEKSFNRMMSLVDFGWFDTFFYPDPSTRFDVVLSLLNGPCNYSSTIERSDGTSTIASTMGCAIPNTKGTPEYENSSMIPVLIHECCHGFCNPLNEANWNDMKDVAQLYYDLDSTFFNNSPYPNPVLMMNETFVEASVVRYLSGHDIKVEDLTQQEMADWYLNKVGLERSHWALEPTVVKALEERESRPDLYPTMKDFMKRLCNLLEACK